MSKHQPEPTDEQEIMSLFIKEVKRRLHPDNAGELKAADLEMIRKLLQDNSVTMASVRRGDFGEAAQRISEDFPFPGDQEEGPVFQ